MALYAYLCRTCGEFDSLRRGDTHLCPECGNVAARRFLWRNSSVLMDHYNPAFGQVVSSRRQARDLAKAASDRQSEQLGMTVNYELTDIHDHEAAGITKDEKAHYAALAAEPSP